MTMKMNIDDIEPEISNMGITKIGKTFCKKASNTLRVCFDVCVGLVDYFAYGEGSKYQDRNYDDDLAHAKRKEGFVPKNPEVTLLLTKVPVKAILGTILYVGTTNQSLILGYRIEKKEFYDKKKNKHVNNSIWTTSRGQQLCNVVLYLKPQIADHKIQYGSHVIPKKRPGMEGTNAQIGVGPWKELNLTDTEQVKHVAYIANIPNSISAAKTTALVVERLRNLTPDTKLPLRIESDFFRETNTTILRVKAVDPKEALNVLEKGFTDGTMELMEHTDVSLNFDRDSSHRQQYLADKNSNDDNRQVSNKVIIVVNKYGMQKNFYPLDLVCIKSPVCMARIMKDKELQGLSPSQSAICFTTKRDPEELRKSLQEGKDAGESFYTIDSSNIIDIFVLERKNPTFAKSSVLSQDYVSPEDQYVESKLKALREKKFYELATELKVPGLTKIWVQIIKATKTGEWNKVQTSAEYASALQHALAQAVAFTDETDVLQSTDANNGAENADPQKNDSTAAAPDLTHEIRDDLKEQKVDTNKKFEDIMARMETLFGTLNTKIDALTANLEIKSTAINILNARLSHVEEYLTEEDAGSTKTVKKADKKRNSSSGFSRRGTFTEHELNAHAERIDPNKTLQQSGLELRSKISGQGSS